MNLFEGYSPVSDEEQVDILLENSDIRIERIVSAGQISPPGFWYDQDQDEWVTVLQGEARLTTETEAIFLKKGDSAFLPAELRHRVDYTSTEPPCIWLCVFSGGKR
ncbi:MAG: cupin domain-containing protein [Oscillospiraceae bacterium]|nr:cupin domain-containing protein [Oscillospiraceae bacterium]